MKNVILILILFSVIALNISPAKSQSIRMIQADTIFKGYDSGETSSVKVINHGTSLIYNHAGKLYEMSAITYEPIREIKLDESLPVVNFSVDENCKYLIYNTTVDSITIVANYNTGKTIKVLLGSYYMSKDYLFLLYYNTARGNNYTVGISKFAKIAFSNLAPLDTFIYKFQVFGGFTPRLDGVRTIYNQNKLIIGDGGIYSAQSYHVYSTTWLIVDFEAGSVINVDVGKAKRFSADYQNYLYLSKNGKYLVDIQYNLGKEDYFFVYDSTHTYLYQILGSEIKKLINDQNLTFVRNTMIIDDKYLLFSVEQKIMNKIIRRTLVYDLEAQYPIRLIDFDNYAYDYNNKLIFSNKPGCLATLGLEQVPVLEDEKLSDDYSVTYTNNILFITSQESRNAAITILDMTGSIVFTQKGICVNTGINSLNLPNQLSCGIYFCIIQTKEATILRKFMVIK